MYPWKSSGCTDAIHVSNAEATLAAGICQLALHEVLIHYEKY